MRRRAHAARGAPAPRHGSRGAARRVPALRRAALDRPRRSRLELAWPEHPDFPPYGYVVRRRELDEMVADQAVKAGATLWQGAEAIAPIVEGGLRHAARWCTTRTRARPRRSAPAYVVVADGANSRFGRALGTSRDRSYPLGMAIRGYFTSPYHDEPWIESHLDLRDRDGNHLPGIRLDLPGWRRHRERRRRPALDVLGLEGHQHHASHGGVLRDRARALGHLARNRHVRADRRPPADRRLGDSPASARRSWSAATRPAS